MAYKVIVSPKAQEEFYDAIDYYNDVSAIVPEKFVGAIQKAYHNLSVDPFFGIRYHKIRAIPVKGFPYLLFFIVDEQNFEVIVLSCFHTSKNPHKYPY
ncbi:type II toxin-antitoxin system RelE/ParE family toxin [Flavobacterium sp. RHBU_3]|uniref:type II toxin-antitoxin system RelE/ParE family toxin n=1 Tax=Flavobacterium sp. RHBU_3 TaxID=3391184 RepID=UPI00398474B2